MFYTKNTVETRIEKASKITILIDPTWVETAVEEVGDVDGLFGSVEEAGGDVDEERGGSDVDGGGRNFFKQASSAWGLLHAAAAWNIDIYKKQMAQKNIVAF